MKTEDVVLMGGVFLAGAVIALAALRARSPASSRASSDPVANFMRSVGLSSGGSASGVYGDQGGMPWTLEGVISSEERKAASWMSPETTY